MNGPFFKPQASLFLAVVAIVTLMATMPARPQMRGRLGDAAGCFGNAVGADLGNVRSGAGRSLCPLIAAH